MAKKAKLKTPAIGNSGIGKTKKAAVCDSLVPVSTTGNDGKLVQFEAITVNKKEIAELIINEEKFAIEDELDPLYKEQGILLAKRQDFNTTKLGNLIKKDEEYFNTKVSIIEKFLGRTLPNPNIQVYQGYSTDGKSSTFDVVFFWAAPSKAVTEYLAFQDHPALVEYQKANELNNKQLALVNEKIVVLGKKLADLGKKKERVSAGLVKSELLKTKEGTKVLEEATKAFNKHNK